MLPAKYAFFERRKAEVTGLVYTAPFITFVLFLEQMDTINFEEFVNLLQIVQTETLVSF